MRELMVLGSPGRGAVSSARHFPPMPAPRIYCDVRLGPGAQLSLAPDAAQHVSKALRLKAGDALTVFDGSGGEYEAAIQRIEKGRVDIKVAAGRHRARAAPAPGARARAARGRQDGL